MAGTFCGAVELDGMGAAGAAGVCTATGAGVEGVGLLDDPGFG